MPGDGAYKAFFSDKDMVTSLVQDFVRKDFVRDMDFSTLEAFPTARVTRGFSGGRTTPSGVCTGKTSRAISFSC